jgi:hypothetical protein
MAASCSRPAPPATGAQHIGTPPRLVHLPSGKVSYLNELDQPVNPFTGQTVGRSDPLWHQAGP